MNSTSNKGKASVTSWRVGAIRFLIGATALCMVSATTYFSTVCGQFSCAGQGSLTERRTESIDAAFMRMLQQRDLNLQTLSRERAGGFLKDLVEQFPNRAYGGFLDFEPLFLWTVGTDKRPLYVLIESQTTVHPGCTKIRLTEIGGPGQVLSESSFGLGWRTYVTGGVQLASVLNRHVIILGTDSWPGNHGYVSNRQYFTKVGNSFSLIRLEDAKGDAIRNPYYSQNLRHGPAMLRQRADEWISDLKSKDESRVLRALVWLGGIHWDLRPGEKLPQNCEDHEDIRVVRELRRDDEVQACLRELATSKERWIMDSAKLALEPINKRFDQ